MTDISRHGLGALLGVIATPVIAGCFVYGTGKVRLAVAHAISELPAGDSAGTDWGAVGAMLAGAVAIGLVAGSRVSPLASLVPGTLIGLVGLLWVVAPAWMYEQARMRIHSEDLFFNFAGLAAGGTFLIVGVALLAASALPSRWHGSRAADPAPAPAEPREPGPDEDVLGE